MGCKLHHGTPLMRDYTPAAAKTAEDVVVTNGVPEVVHADIAANRKGAIARCGGVYQLTADGAIAANSKVYWDASAGKVTLTATGNTHFGWLTDDSSSSTDGDLVYVLHWPVPGLSGGGAASGPMINTNDTTVGAATLTAAAIAGGLITRSGSTADYTDTTATAALIIAANPDPIVNDSWLLLIKNTVPFNETIAAGTGVTLSGQTIVPPNSVGAFLVTQTSTTAVSIRGVGSMPMASPQLEVNTAITTVGAGTLTAAGIVGRLITRSGSTAAYTDTTATAAQIVAAMANANIGDSFEFTIKNTVAFAETLSAGTGVTLAGLTVVPPLSVGRFLVKLDSLTAVTITGISTCPLANLPPAKFSTAATSNGTAAAGELTGAGFTVMKLTANGANAYTTRTAAEMFGDIPNCQIGLSFIVRLISGGDNTVTLTAGTNVTITGTATAATGKFRDFCVTFTSATAVTFQDIGGN